VSRRNTKLRDYRIEIERLTYDEAKTLYAVLTGNTFTNLHSTLPGSDTFSGLVTLTRDGAVDGEAVVTAGPMPRTERLTAEEIGEVNAQALVDIDTPNDGVTGRAPAMFSAEPVRDRPRPVKDVPQA
jgi:hypothetical protein